MKKKSIKPLAKLSMLGIALFTPTFALAAGKNPKNAFANLFTGLIDLLQYLAPRAAALAIAWYGIQLLFAQESHDRADLRKSMKNTLVIVAIIFVGSMLVDWVISLVK